MKFDSFNRWLSLLASVGVLAGFALVAFQLNLNTKAIRLQTAISVNQQMVAGEIAYMGETTHTAFALAAFDPSALTTEQVGQVWAYLNVGMNSVWNQRHTGLSGGAGLLERDEGSISRRLRSRSRRSIGEVRSSRWRSSVAENGGWGQERSPGLGAGRTLGPLI